MKKNRSTKLQLHRETLQKLSHDDLSNVVGGSGNSGDPYCSGTDGCTRPVNFCTSDPCGPTADCTEPC